MTNTYFKKNFQLYKQMIKELNESHGDDYNFVSSTHNAILKLFGFNPDVYYIYKECFQYSYNYYVRKKSDHKINFKINFNYHGDLTIFCDSRIYGDSEEELLNVNPFVQDEFESIAKHLIKYEIKEHQKKRSKIYQVANSEHQNNAICYARNNGIYNNMTEEEALKKYVLVNKIVKEYDSDDLFSFDFIIANIICMREFNSLITLDDYYFINSLNLDLFYSLEKSVSENIDPYRELFIFNKDNGLTDDSKKLFKLNFMI